MIDTARHFLNVSTIFKIIESMGIHKLNVLQIHLTDDQSFPFESLSHPNLTAVGAFDNASIYTHADVTAIVKHANARGIVVQVELDMPAHCGSWQGVPGFLDQWDLDHHTSAMPDPSKPATYKVIADVLAELRSLGVSTTHQIGGDEFTGAAWEADPALKAWANGQHLSFPAGGCERSSPSGKTKYNASDCSVLCRFHQQHALAAKSAGYTNIMMWSDASDCEGLNMIFPNAIVDLWGAGDLGFHGCKGDKCVAEDWAKGGS